MSKVSKAWKMAEKACILGTGAKEILEDYKKSEKKYLILLGWDNLIPNPTQHTPLFFVVNRANYGDIPTEVDARSYSDIAASRPARENPCLLTDNTVTDIISKLFNDSFNLNDPTILTLSQFKKKFGPLVCDL